MEGRMGVEVRLTGASRDGRTPKQFHDALKALVGVVEKTVATALGPRSDRKRINSFASLC